MRFRTAMFLPVLLLTGCGGSLVDYRSPESGMRYFPPPAAFRTATQELGARVPAALRTPEVRLFFATTRRPGGTSFVDEADAALHLGQLDMRIGPIGTTWDDLVDWARLNEQQIPPVRVELATVDRFNDSNEEALDDRFLATLEPMYAHGGRRALLYVHGDDTAFAEAAATLACMHHHQGRRGAAVLFSWPAGSEPRDAAKALARLIALISGPGRIGRIDCLANASGTAILTAALRQSEHTVGRDGLSGLRIGSIVLDSPDLTRHLVSTDLALLAATTGRTVVYSSRAFAAPDMRQGLMAQREHIEFVDVSGLPGPTGSRHGAWLANPLVVTDALFTLLSGLPAGQRGLVHGQDGLEWTLPPDYALHAAARMSATLESSGE